MTRPEVYVRRSDRSTVGDASKWNRLTVAQRVVGVGRWTIELADARTWELFHRDVNLRGWSRGVLILRGGMVLCSGWADEVDTQTSSGRPAWVVSGFDDNDYLEKHLAWPQPTQGISQQSWTGRHSEVGVVSETRWKAFCTANLVNRLNLPGVVVPASQGRGEVNTSRSYFRSLLNITEGIHAGSGHALVFEVKQNLDRQIVVDVREKRNLVHSIQFSPDVDTATSWSAKSTTPNATRAIVAAGRELEDRQHRLRTQEPTAHRAMRPELLVAAHGVDTNESGWQGEADSEGDAALVENRGRSSFQVQVNESPGHEYGPDYLVGDTVRAWLTEGQGADDPRVDDEITEAELTWSGGDFGSVSMWVGPKDDPDEYDARAERDLRRRVSRLERAM